jgi:hypothetical protein
MRAAVLVAAAIGCVDAPRPGVDGGVGGLPDASVDAASDATSTCGLTPQGGCAAGDKCTLVDPELDGFAAGCCAAGGFCTFIGVLPPDLGGSRLCRAICASDDACEAGQRCAILDPRLGAGFCGPTCAPLAGACGDGMTCAELRPGAGGSFDLFTVCRVPGSGAAGAPCVADSDCGADHVCPELPGQARVCRPLCDASHPCSGGQCFQPANEIGACT